LLPIFLRQHWLVTDDDVASVGGTRDQIDRRVRSGRWTTVDRRVHRPLAAPATWHAALLAPILGSRPGVQVAASDLAAAALHGIPGFGHGRPELSTPREFNLRRPGVRIRTSNDLDRCRIVNVEGVPTTDLPRTLLDLGRSVGDKRLLRAAEWARRERGVTWSDLVSTLAKHARRGRGGIQRFRRIVVANAHRTEATDSDLEVLLLALLREHGLPEPVLHHTVFDGDRFVAEVDAAYPRLRLAVEVDGLVHLDEAVWQKDQRRQNDLVLVGWTVLRFSWDRIVHHPEAVVTEIRSAIRRAERRLAA
jgi:very-short-patch-repair endonuclease